MLRLPVFCGLGILALTMLVSVGGTQDAKKDKVESKKEEKEIKGSVPKGWGKSLKLSKDQTKKIQQIDIEYKTKIAELDKKIKELKLQSQIEMTKQLTDDQKATLAKSIGLDVKDKDKDKDKGKDKDK
jgi:TolA-binding protein